MTDTEAALLRAIAAHPEEDTPRLVFADYLDERGGESATARAEFIRLQVRVAYLTENDPERATVFRRIDQLLCVWDTTWQKEMPDGFQLRSGYRRGFPYRAAAVASAVIAAADDPRLLLVEYLELTVDLSLSRLRAVVAQQLFARLTELVVRGNLPLGWSGARKLAEGEYPRLERLGLARQRIGNYGLRTLCESWGFPRLRELDLSENEITDAGAAVLLDSHLIRRLQRLRMWGNTFGNSMRERLNAHGSGPVVW